MVAQGLDEGRPAKAHGALDNQVLLGVGSGQERLELVLVA
jgi:hypothetical protein